jgi:hypothetical protein
MKLLAIALITISISSYFIEANKTEVCETFSAVLKQVFDYQLGVYVKVYDSKIELLTKQVSGNKC